MKTGINYWKKYLTISELDARIRDVGHNLRHLENLNKLANKDEP